MSRLTAVSFFGILLLVKNVAGAFELEIWTQGSLPRLLKTIPVGKSDSFTLSWEHSVERFPWRETFQITPNGGLRLLKSAIQGYGAGTPDRSLESGAFRRERGWMIYEPTELEIKDLPIGLSLLAPHWIESDGARVSLLEIAGEQTIVLRPSDRAAGNQQDREQGEE